MSPHQTSAPVQGQTNPNPEAPSAAETVRREYEAAMKMMRSIGLNADVIKRQIITYYEQEHVSRIIENETRLQGQSLVFGGKFPEGAGRTIDHGHGSEVKYEVQETCDGGAVRSPSVAGETGPFPFRYDLILNNTVAMDRLAATYGEGSKKYGDHNWKKGCPEHNCINHCMAHIQMHLKGDKSEDHLAHATWNLLTLMWMQVKRPDLLDLSGTPDPDRECRYCGGLMSRHSKQDVADCRRELLREMRP